MSDQPIRRNRKSTRLQGYDYAQDGAYFVTICTQNRAHLFGVVADGEMRLNQYGKIVEACWDDLPRHYPHIELDAFVVMPNHIHGIIVILNSVPLASPVGEGFKPSPTQHGLSEIVRGLKTFSARQINKLRDTPGATVWQRSFHDRIIRSEMECDRLREYIFYNPAGWEADTLYS